MNKELLNRERNISPEDDTYESLAFSRIIRSYYPCQEADCTNHADRAVTYREHHISTNCQKCAYRKVGAINGERFD